jgi:hypothetical protein
VNTDGTRLLTQQFTSSPATAVPDRPVLMQPRIRRVAAAYGVAALLTIVAVALAYYLQRLVGFPNVIPL